MGLLVKMFGDKSLINIDNKVDELVGIIPNKKEEESGEDATGDIIDNFLSHSSEDEVESLFQNVSVPTERIARYNIYNEINKSVPIIKRIIKVYIANILPKNPVDGTSIIYRSNSDEDSSVKEVANLMKKSENFAKKIVKEYKIAEKLKHQILPSRLLYGDCFVEVVDIEENTKNQIDLNNSMGVLSEAKIEKDILSEIDTLTPHSDISNIDFILNKIAGTLVEFEEIIPEGMYLSEQNNITSSDDDLSHILLKIHKPRNIIILNTKYGSRIGYLEVINNTLSNQPISQSLSKMIGKVTTMGLKDEISQDDLVNKLIFHVLKKIIAKTKKDNNSKNIDSVIKSLDDDIYLFIKRMFVEQGIYKKKAHLKKINVRFIPSNRMIQFSNPSSDYMPFGESVVESLILPSKLYILAQLSNAITKLSRASLLRTWKLDVGSSQMNSQMIQRIRRELSNTRITLSDLSSFKSIPKILSDFKDMFILSKQGNTPVDVEVKSMGDTSIKVQDLEDARREIIALSGIPAPYLGYMDVVELREQLVHTNVGFATEIIDQQENDIKGINQIIDIVADIKKLNYIPSKYTTVSLIPPVVLILQLIEMTLSSVGNIAGVFQNMNLQIDPYYFLEQYVPHINWKSFKLASEKKIVEDKTKTDMGGGEDQSGGGMY